MAAVDDPGLRIDLNGGRGALTGSGVGRHPSLSVMLSIDVGRRLGAGVTGLAVTAESSGPSMMRANIPATGGQILPDLTRAVWVRRAKPGLDSATRPAGWCHAKWVPCVASIRALLQAAAGFVVADPGLVIESAALAAARRSLDGSGLLLLGEVHGVAENPLLIRALMRAFGLTSLALEWPDPDLGHDHGLAAGLPADLRVRSW